jgi:hypothetical protein
MSERRPAQNIGELDIHLSNLQQRVAEIALSMQQMATKQDIDSIRVSMGLLATKAEVAAEIQAIREEVNRNKPSTIGRTAVSVMAGLLVLVAAVGVILKLADWINHATITSAGKP